MANEYGYEPQIHRYFQKFTELPPDVMADIAETIDSSIQENFDVGGRYGTDNELGGGDTPWKPSQRVEEEGGQTLALEGIMRKNVSVRVSDDVILITSGVIYGGVHHFGRAAKNPGPIPMRPWAVVQNEDLEEINDIVVEHFKSIEP